METQNCNFFVAKHGCLEGGSKDSWLGRQENPTPSLCIPYIPWGNSYILTHSLKHIGVEHNEANHVECIWSPNSPLEVRLSVYCASLLQWDSGSASFGQRRAYYCVLYIPYYIVLILLLLHHDVNESNVHACNLQVQLILVNLMHL